MQNRRRAAGVVENPWRALCEFTDARIGLGRAGISLPTERLLAFQLAHAQAKDAVHLPLDVGSLCDALAELRHPVARKPALRLHTQASDRITYLQRPDLGRCLDEDSRALVNRADSDGAARAACDLAFVVVDGLSARAVQAHAAPFIDALTALLVDDNEHDWTLAPLTVIEQGRVAIGDEVGELLNARAVLVLVGERPGLSSPDSLGLYLTWDPHRGVSDAERNCISNVRPAGLALEEAAKRAFYLLREARRLELTGVKLKDRSDEDVIEHDEGPGNFLIS